MPHHLNILIWFPIISGLMILLLPKGESRSSYPKILALLTALISLVVAIMLAYHFNPNSIQMQYEHDTPWISMLNIHYHLGIDGLSLSLILLSILTNIVIIIATWNSIENRVNQYMASFLILQGLLVGVFSAMDAILFYTFWESTLIPMYLIIGIWGSDRRIYAAIKFFLYTFLGSVLMSIVRYSNNVCCKLIRIRTESHFYSIFSCICN